MQCVGKTFYDGFNENLHTDFFPLLWYKFPQCSITIATTISLCLVKSKIPRSYISLKAALKAKSLLNSIKAILQARHGNTEWSSNHENHPGPSARE